MKSWKNWAKKLLIIQNWTFFHVLAWLPKRPILGRNRNLKGSSCLLSIFSLALTCLIFFIHTIHFVSDEVLFSIFWFGFWRTYMHSLLTITEMVLFKIVYIFKYSRIAAMNEYFLTRFITSFNFVVIFGFTIIRILLKEHTGTRRYFHQFAKPYEVYKKVEIP